MAELTKFRATEVAFHIKHDLRDLPAGKAYGNEAVDPALSKDNYSLLKGRCETSTKANNYRKKIESECFHYNRKDLVHAVEIAVQCPSDCPEEQKEAFFQETFNYICSTLPMGERCVFVAEVHRDERHFSSAGEMISKDHLHVMYVPAVPDKKHEGFSYRLCADELTKRAKLKAFHPGLQKHLDEAGIHATVFRKKEGDGKAVALSVAQLKELTAKTGITLDHNLTIDELAEIINSNVLTRKQNKILQADLAAKTNEAAALQDKIKDLQSELSAKTAELEQSRSKEQELSEKVEQLENRSKTANQEQTWGHTTGWGSHTRGWGTNTQTITTEEEKTW